MQFHYRPDPSAIPRHPWNIAFLSQRDVELTIPIPFVTAPGISITAACFSDGRFEDSSAEKCLSNLLAVGFRRLIVDLYWDANRHVWSFCPVEVPSEATRDRSKEYTSTPLHIVSNVSPSVSATTSGTLSSSTFPSPGATNLNKRQIDMRITNKALNGDTTHASSRIVQATVTVGVSTASHTTVPIVPTNSVPKADEILFSIGPYVCSRTPSLNILNQVLLHFLDTTDNTLEATLKYVVLNIHAAAEITTPEGPALKPAAADLPLPSLSLGTILSRPFYDYLFTPATLRGQRRDLNNSWYLAAEQYEPDMAYYQRDVEQGVATSPNGWPSESVMEFQNDNHQRLLFGFGTIDPQMEDYDRSRDEHVVFDQGYTETETQRCIYNGQTFSLASANNSWAVSTISDLQSQEISDSGYDSPISDVATTTRCGKSVVLNQSLSDATADEQILPYKEFSYSSIWSWAWGEPQTRNDSDTFRCAVLDPASHGRWRVRECSTNFRAACRINNQPYQWTVSETSDEYRDAVGHCPDNTKFDVPRTALENRHLLNSYMMDSSNSAEQSPIWIDFNSLDLQDCWVSGRNSSCPYQLVTDDAAQIYVPTIAGLIIVIVAALLLLVKCGANRRNSRRRRRGADGWDYEGVPS